MERFFLTIAREVAPLQVYLYNIPSRTGNHLAPAFIERLSQEPNIVGIKDSTGDLAQLLNLLAVPEVRVLPGADHLIVQTLQAGAAGFVSGPASVLPEPYVALWEAWENKDYAALLYWQDVIVKVSKLVHFGARIDLLKALAAHRLPGIGSVRAPLMTTDGEELARVRVGLQRVLTATSLSEEAYGWL